MTNVDPEEIAHFNKMADEWWDRNGPCRPLHDLNPIRMQWISDRCSLRDKTVLDIGCGGGILTESLAKRGALVTGIDISQSLIKVAIQHAAHTHVNIEYLPITAEALAQHNDRQFDIITCLELLEHVPNPAELIHAAAHLLKPGGHLFLSSINRGPKAYLMAILGAEYILKLLPKNTHHYDKFIRPSELASALRTEHLTLLDIQGLKYNPFTHRCSITQDPSVNYLVWAQSV